MSINELESKRPNPGQGSVCLDACCYTYLVEACENVTEPTGSAAEERTAMVRIFFYGPIGSLTTTPTVERECAEIKDRKKLQSHVSWLDFHICSNPTEDLARVKLLRELFLKHHPEKPDCQILAEAEEDGVSVLLTNDTEFIGRLNGVSAHVKIQRPTEYWQSLQIERGSTPKTEAPPDAPLSKESWWRW